MIKNEKEIKEHAEKLEKLVDEGANYLKILDESKRIDDLILDNFSYLANSSNT